MAKPQVIKNVNVKPSQVVTTKNDVIDIMTDWSFRQWVTMPIHKELLIQDDESLGSRQLQQKLSHIVATQMLIAAGNDKKYTPYMNEKNVEYAPKRRPGFNGGVKRDAFGNVVYGWREKKIKARRYEATYWRTTYDRDKYGNIIHTHRKGSLRKAYRMVEAEPKKHHRITPDPEKDPGNRQLHLQNTVKLIKRNYRWAITYESVYAHYQWEGITRRKKTGGKRTRTISNKPWLRDQSVHPNAMSKWLSPYMDPSSPYYAREHQILVNSCKPKIKRIIKQNMKGK